MLKLSDQEKQDIIRYLEADKDLPEKYRFLLFADKREVELVWNGKTGDDVFENEWQSFRTKKDRTLELESTAHECKPGKRKLAVKVVDIFGNDTMTIVEVGV